MGWFGKKENPKRSHDVVHVDAVEFFNLGFHVLESGIEGGRWETTHGKCRIGIFKTNAGWGVTALLGGELPESFAFFFNFTSPETVAVAEDGIRTEQDGRRITAWNHFVSFINEPDASTEEA